ncbi:MAG: dihydrofolate reductase [Bernardetiaceae bacterium]|nr:dihydrofolate reductase [Bernardetiaceae bacterium]
MKSHFVSKLLLLAVLPFLLLACQDKSTDSQSKKRLDEDNTTEAKITSFTPETFADLRILHYKVEGFEELTAQQKSLVYYLSQAARAGRDIIYDQNYKHNLRIRKTIEGIYDSYSGERSGADWDAFEVYAKRVWFSNGIHHHYSEKKFMPDFSEDYFVNLIQNSDAGKLPLTGVENTQGLIDLLTPVLFDPEVAPKRVNKAKDVDLVQTSATNYYADNLTQKEVKDFYKKIKPKGEENSISYGLNSQLIKQEGEPSFAVGFSEGDIHELVWCIERDGKEGKYAPALREMVKWLRKATEVAENDQQRKVLELLIEYYETGDLKKFDEMNIAWVNSTNTVVDFIHGFIEVYGDPLGYRGAYEAVIFIEDKEASRQMKIMSDNAQYFEDNSSIMDEHKKKEVKGVSYQVISVVQEAGDAAPATPIGINLPNADWIRADHGSKSVSLANIEEAYEMASGEGTVSEFYVGEERQARIKKHGKLASRLHTAMHEVIGHASGKLNPGVGTPKETLGNYASTLEEARADLVALYYIYDQKLIDLELMPSLEVGKAEYDSYIMNGMMLQLRRLKEGDDIEEDHMRNRQLVAAWVYDKGQGDKVITRETIDGKTYFVVNDYDKLRTLFGDLLREIQRIKSEGDYKAAELLVETYGVKADPELLREVKQRYEKFNVAPYSGFVQPRLIPVKDGDEVIDVLLEYPKDFKSQMLDFGKKHSFLPIYE